MSIRIKYADFTLADADLNVCDTAIATALEKTAGLPEMATALVKHLAKIGNKSESFAREAHALGKQHEGLLPRDMDLETMERALRNRDALRERLVAVRHLAERLEAAIVLLGVDSYRDGLDIYHSLKRGGTTQALREAVKELGRNFRKSPTKPKVPPTPAGSEAGKPELGVAAERAGSGGSERVQARAELAQRVDAARDAEPTRIAEAARVAEAVRLGDTARAGKPMRPAEAADLSLARASVRVAPQFTWEACGGPGLAGAWTVGWSSPGFGSPGADRLPLDHAAAGGSGVSSAFWQDVG